MHDILGAGSNKPLAPPPFLCRGAKITRGRREGC